MDAGALADAPAAAAEATAAAATTPAIKAGNSTDLIFMVATSLVQPVIETHGEPGGCTAASVRCRNRSPRTALSGYGD